jgi:hypothetical protein
MSKKFLQELIRNLQEFYKCPTCDTNYHFDDIKFLGNVDGYCFVQLSCHHCSLPVLATIAEGDKKLAGGKRRSDATRSEQARFKARGEITANEIAGFHGFIRDFSGSLASIARTRNKRS